MAVREITLWPSRDLITMAVPAVLDKRSADSLDDLADTMLAAQGLGLASTQVRDTWRDGFPSALIVVVEDPRPPMLQGTSIPRNLMRVWQLANPKITWESEEKRTVREGCLSIPDYYEHVSRYLAVHVEADVLHDDGTWESRRGDHHIQATGIFAHALQHEIDHLNGAFFVTEYGSQLKIDIARKFAAKRWVKQGLRTWTPGKQQQTPVQDSEGTASGQEPKGDST